MRKRNGFTIVETALVIAVGGLILIMVFIVLPTLRAQQRDTARREDVAKLINVIKDYQTNNRGALPVATHGQQKDDFGNYKWESIRCGDDENEDTWDTLYCEYLGDNFVDPDGVQYRLQVGYCRPDGSNVPDQQCNIGAHNYNTINVHPADPNSDETTFPNEYMMTIVLGAKCSGNKSVGVSNPRKVAVMYTLERGGTYCANS